jgi:hypothetical protein
MPYELFTRQRMLPVGETLKVLLLHLAMKTPFLCEFAVPFAAYAVTLGVVVLLGVGELFLVICLGLAGAQRFGNGEYFKSLTRRMVPARQQYPSGFLPIHLDWPFDWLGSRINIERAIVAQHVDATKTQGSKKTISIARELLEHLRLWKQCSQFRADTDWVFASPMKIGRLPYSYTGVRQTLQRAADAASIGKLTTHAFRHSFRTWLNQTGAPIATQQKLMRHSSLAMTMDTDGTTFDAELTAASSKVAERVFAIGSPDGSQQGS